LNIPEIQKKETKKQEIAAQERLGENGEKRVAGGISRRLRVSAGSTPRATQLQTIMFSLFCISVVLALQFLFLNVSFFLDEY